MKEVRKRVILGKWNDLISVSNGSKFRRDGVNERFEVRVEVSKSGMFC